MVSVNFQAVRYLLGQFKSYYPVIGIYSICISFLTLATPISVQSLVSTFSFGPYLQPIIVLSLILLGLLTTLGVLRSMQYLLVEHLQRNLYAKATASICRSYFIGDESGDQSLKDRANRYFDIILIHKNLAYLVTDGIAMSLQTFIGLILISLYHPYFIIFGILIFLAILMPLFFWGRRGLESAVAESSEKYDVADYIKSLSTEGRSEIHFEQKIIESNEFIDNFLKKRSRHFKTVFMQNIMYVSMYAALNALLLGLGGYLVINNQLTVGQLVAAEIVVNAILVHFLYAKKYLESFYDMFAAIQKVSVFYDFVDGQNYENTNDDLDSLLKLSTKSFYGKYNFVNSIYSPKSYFKIVRGFLFGFSLVVAGLLLTPWQQYSRGRGKVLAYNPNDRIQKITATVSGVVEKWLVHEGQFVKKGEPIVRIVDNDPNFLVRLETQRDAAIARFEAKREASNIGRINYHRQEDLVKEGLSSPKEFEKAKIIYKKLRSEEAAAAVYLAKAETDLSRQRQQVITAPRDGQVLRVLLGSGMTTVKSGDALVDFVPLSTESAVELFLDGNDLPLVYEGRKVRLQFEGWPAVQLTGWPSIAVGSFGGIVKVIDPSVSKDGSFRVLIKPDPEDDVAWPSQQLLRQGSRAVGIVLLGRVSIGFELWRQINGFPKSMEKPPGLQDRGRDTK